MRRLVPAAGAILGSVGFVEAVLLKPDTTIDRLQSDTATAAVRVIRVPQGGIQPEAVVDERGVLHLLYFAGDARTGNLFYVRSPDYGETFSQPIRVNSEPGSAIAAGTIRGGQLAVGRDGRAHVAWNGSESATLRGPADPATGRPGAPMLYARLDDGRAAFEPQRNLIARTVHLDGGGSIAADRSGRVFVAWHGNAIENGASGEAGRRVWLARSSDDGRTFATETPISSEATGACGCCGLRLATGHRAGMLHLLYRSAQQQVNRDVHLLSSNDAGASFRATPVHHWKIDACPMTSMSIAAHDARVLAAWETAGEVYFGRIDRGNPAVDDITSPPGGTGGRKHPRVAIGRTGETLLVWTEGMAWARGGDAAWRIFSPKREPMAAGRLQGVPVWSFAAVVARPDGGFTVFY